MFDEQAEVVEDQIQPDAQAEESAPAKDKDIRGILSDALEGDKQGTPKVQPAPAVEGTEQAPLETPFLELVNGEAKLPFKSEEDFLNFLESNEVLKNGWLRQSDYTRKTQELAQMREQLEQSTKEDEKSWGGQKPDQTSMKSLQSLWSVYANGEPVVQDAINKFVTDINLMARGKDPVGPIKSLLGGTQSEGQGTQDPLVHQMRQEISALKQELRGFRHQTEEERNTKLAAEQEVKRAEAEQKVDSWLTQKDKAGVKISQDELYAMADLMSIVDEKGQPKLSLDEAHNMVLAKLGRLQGSVAKQVMRGANEAKKKSPLAPSSRGSATDEPEATTIKGILSQGLKSLSEGN